MSEKEIVREINALTIMPLPVRIPASWYDVLPKVLPLIRWSSEQPRFYMAEEMIEVFLQRWRRVLIRREGKYVWLHLGGVACYEVVPNFVKGVKYRIESADEEIRQNGGDKAVIEHWRNAVEELKDLDDSAVTKARAETMRLLRPEIWHDKLAKSWGFAAERAHSNFGKIRPVIKKWVAKYEEQYNLDEPFGGRLSGKEAPAPST